MRTVLRRIAVFASVAAAAATCASVPAAALRDTDILGNWCGTESNYHITRASMTVTRASDNAQLVFDILKFESRDDSLVVAWRRADGKVARTEFTEFSADGRTMVQLSNAGGPRREFRRC
jgi:hypothetical protein